jgi:hypothetical protein
LEAHGEGGRDRPHREGQQMEGALVKKVMQKKEEEQGQEV